MKNGYRITDAHAHVFPDKIAEKATEGISHFYDLPMEYHGRVAEMLENGMAAGVDNFLICSAGDHGDTGAFYQQLSGVLRRSLSHVYRIRHIAPLRRPCGGRL